jgi:glycosyltransferase involved in cell wall biosynthesis
MILVSVIIPVYNAELHLKKCIESLLSQTLKSCEFIFINDGSIDISKLIIEEFQKNDNRIILLNQENQGVSIARNQGLKIAKGNYIGFVDADDYVESDYFENLYNEITQNNLYCVVGKYKSTLDGHTSISNHPFPSNEIFKKEFIQNTIIPFFIKEDKLNTIWNKLFRTEIITSIPKIQFPKGIVIGEDGLFNLLFFNQCNSVKFIDYCGYNYQEIAKSATRDASKKDYFAIALQQFNYDYKNEFGVDLADDVITKLKSLRLINAVISLVNVYFNSNLKSKNNYVYAMISNPIIRKILKEYWIEIVKDKTKFQILILKGIQYKSVFLLQMATSYSNYRNKK